MRKQLSIIIYALFFFSGAASLIYQIVWVRSLTLVFGGSHLAVTAVLTIFMGGLALGGYLFGKYADRVRKPLELYGFLELWIATFALGFYFLMEHYPALYVALARGHDNDPAYLFGIRLAFTVVAIIIPTTLMGGTLPILSTVLARQPREMRQHLSSLYGFNTLGAVAGAAAAGFFLIRLYTLSMTLFTATTINILIGLFCILYPEEFTDEADEPAVPDVEVPPAAVAGGVRPPLLAYRLVVWGIGISGFCALGYEVLWTRVLSMVSGANVYAFTIILVAFLTGIALGSESYALVPRLLRLKPEQVTTTIVGFGTTQVIIGVAALVVTATMAGLPGQALYLQRLFGSGREFFSTQVLSGSVLAFFYLVVPAFFMGLAFPLAGRVNAEYKRVIGRAVGEVLAYNTIGAILGAAGSGFVMIYLFGIERSLQLLAVVNIGIGLVVVCSVTGRKTLTWGTAAAVAAVLVLLASDAGILKSWNTKYLAVFRYNQPEAFRSTRMIAEALDNTDVLYYAEGTEAVVSSIKVKGGDQAFLTNGRIEASSRLEGQQCQYTLGHLPMLLNANPKKVLVIGTGSGMTVGATSVHPSVEKVTLVEIEPKVLGIARTFAAYNHHVLDNPKLRIVFNDGRNYLLTTQEKFDVITADPIHPSFRGAGYLYTSEYFKLAADHLEPGGIIAQWLPIYELSPADLKSVVRTFNEHFRYTMLWLTHNDAELIGSNAPIIFNEAELAKRIAVPAVHEDLARVFMGSAPDLLSYFVIGNDQMRFFGESGELNTDDNLYLEFSAPLSIGKYSLMAVNVDLLNSYRESIQAYLLKPDSLVAEKRQQQLWQARETAGALYGKAQALFLANAYTTPTFGELMRALTERYPDYAPARFLHNEYTTDIAKIPVLLKKTTVTLADDQGRAVVKEVSAVLARISSQRASVIFVDNRQRLIYGQLFVDGKNIDQELRSFADQVLQGVDRLYRQERQQAVLQGRGLPSGAAFDQLLNDYITKRIDSRAEDRSANTVPPRAGHPG